MRVWCWTAQDEVSPNSPSDEIVVVGKTAMVGAVVVVGAVVGGVDEFV